jgi:hypothetical protein
MMSDGIEVTKFGALQRLVDSAAIMYFLNVDRLAIYSVLGSAIKMMSELERKRGADRLSDDITFSMVRALHDHLNYRETPYDVMELLNLLQIDLDSDVMEQLKSSDIQTLNQEEISNLIPLDKEAKRKIWGGMLHPFNFLKHASTDDGHSLDEAALSERKLIYFAIHYYLELGLSPTNTMQVFVWYDGSQGGGQIPKVIDPMIGAIANTLGNLEDHEARRACLELIEILSEENHA